MKKPVWSSLAALSAFAILMVLLFGRIFFLESAPGSPDSVTPMALSRALDALQAKTGLYPLWQPWTFSGMPTVAAFSYLSGLYLPNLILGFLHLDGMIVQLLHLLFAGIGGFVLAKRLGLGSVPAFLTGSAFMFSPFMTAMLVYGHGSQLMTAAYMPWVLWAALRLCDKGGLADAGMLALLLGLQLQRAHVQIAYYTWMLVVPLIIVKLLFDSRPGTGKWKTGGFALLAMLLGVGVAMQVYLPALDYLPASARSGVGNPGEAYRYATMWSMHPAELLTFILPGAFGFGGVTYWGFMPFTDFPHYGGTIVLGFAVAGIVAGRKSPLVLFLSGATLLALVISFGSFFSPLYDLFYRFAPLFSSFRVPSMALVIVTLCLAVLAGFGLQAYLDKPVAESSALLKGLGIFIGLAAVLFLAFEAPLEQMLRASFTQVQLDSPDLVSMVNNIRWGLWRGSLFLLIFMTALTAGLLWLGARGMIGARVVAVLLASLSAADLLWIDHQIVGPDERSLRSSPLVERSVLDSALENDDITRFLGSRPGVFRIYPAGPLFTENKFSIAGVESTGGYHAAKLGIYQQFLARTSNLSNVEVLRMLNVGYIVSPVPIQHPAMTMVTSGHMKLASGQLPVAVYQLAGSMPRAWFAPWVASVRNDNEAIDSVMAGKGTQGGVFATGLPWEGSKPFAVGTILSSTRSAESVSMKVRADGEAFLVLSEVFYPQRWRLSVDGREQNAVKVNGLIRGVKVPAGEHEVRFVYDRSRFDTGRNISLVALLLSMGMIIGGNIPRMVASRKSIKSSQQ
ncbi:MAG: hypothetical protein HGB00_06325 [Chlorobiaceae bacterium]|nr:hypothetical protein [Chlorobiaceae bacterium]